MTELLGCPFCGSPGSLFASSDHSGAWEGGCSSEGCLATDCVWDISEELAVAAWNRRASSPPERKEALAAARRMLGPIEPDGSYAVDGFFKDAALVARALLSPPEDVRRETRLEKEVERLRAALAECCAPFDTGPTTVLESASLVASELQRRINIAAEAMQ